MPANDVPLGFCKKCGMAQINQDSKAICPRCDTKTTTKSGLVNRVKDPGDRMDENGNIMGKIEYEEAKKVDLIATKLAVASDHNPPPAEPVDEVADAIDRIDKVLCNMKLSDFADLKEARKVMKYRKKLATLKLELQDFLG